MRLYKILIVDSEIDSVKSMLNIVVDTGEQCVIYRALNIEQALEIASGELPDLIISAHKKSGINGVELIGLLKKSCVTLNIPIIICADNIAGLSIAELSYIAEGVVFMPRPIVHSDMIERIKYLLGLGEGRKTIKEQLGIINDDFAFVRILVENMPHPLVYYDLNGVVLFCNQRFCDSIYRSREHVQGCLIYDCFDESDSDYYKEQDLKLIEDYAEISFEYSINDVDYMFTKSLFLGENNDPQGIMCLLTNVTELKNAHDILLENKKRELVSNSLRLVQLGELNSGMIAELSGLIEYTNEKGVEIIKRVLSKFSLNTSENFWKEFDQRFLGVHESFYLKLNELFPFLTPGEMKLCAFLRLNLSSKDIAAITFQNSQSVDMARYRLRKKMALNPSENLVDFIINL